MSAPPATPIFPIAGGTGISAETLGTLIVNQFTTVEFVRRKVPFITSIEQAQGIVAASTTSHSSSPTQQCSTCEPPPWRSPPLRCPPAP
ncbi:hypothetical protein GCM10023153_11450 [Ornithinibacter aureus]|uniref:Phosphoenolpyruvate synthase regulatory protein n=1 Tax=Ornithinibacter aureus TaxID=622664 RepID=A0ABP8JKW3_9MICO